MLILMMIIFDWIIPDFLIMIFIDEYDWYDWRFLIISIIASY